MNREREKEIIRILLAEKSATVSDLAERLYTSKPSVRRDLANLQRLNLIKRTHGGAALDMSNMSDTKIPFIIRELEHSAAKTEMAKQAAAMVRDNDVVMLDASTSACSVIPYIACKKNIIIITSGIKALETAGECGVAAISTGGEYLPSCKSLVGAEACRMIESYTADIFFFSCRGLAKEGEITDFSLEENYVRRAMLCRAKKKILLCDSSKLYKAYMNTLCRISDTDGVISEKPLPPEFDLQ